MDRNSAMQDLGRNIEQARQARGITKAALAREVGVTPSQVRQWEQGKRIPAQGNMGRLVNILALNLPVALNRNNESRFAVGTSTCVHCGNEFVVFVKKGAKFCSFSCNNKDWAKRQKGEGNPMWKGGEPYRTESGYLKVRDPENPHADSSGRILEHRKVMEGHLGRYLFQWERVHHKNGLRDDNRLENLELWTDGRKDPLGQRVSDVMSEFLKQPEVIVLSDAQKSGLEEAMHRVFRLKIAKL